MSTQGKKTFGSKISIGGATSPATYTKIDEVFQIGEFVGSVGDIDFSNHDDTGDGYRDYLPEDLEDGPTLECQANEIPGNTSQDLVRTAYRNRTKCYWKMELKNGRTEIFLGHVTKCGTDPSALQGRQIFKFSVKVDGDVYSITP